MKIVINCNRNSLPIPTELLEKYCLLLKEFPEFLKRKVMLRDDENLIDVVEKNGKEYGWLIAHIPDDVTWWKIGRESTGEEYIVYREKNGIGTWHNEY